MNIRRLIVWLPCVTVSGIAIALMGRIVFPRQSVPIGDMEWVCLGDNMSEIRLKGEMLVGPCQMEIAEADDVVYGNSNENAPWFIIDKKSHSVSNGDSLWEICSATGVSQPKGRLKFETFLSRWNAINGEKETDNGQGRMLDRIALCFHNPNHAAALACALLPLCWGWRRCLWLGRLLSIALFLALLTTRSRTGLVVAVAEAATWWRLRKGRFRVSHSGSHGLVAVGIAASVVAVLWWMWPRMALDGSVLNRPKIWLAGLRLFAANPDGVGLGNSGALASAFLLGPDVPEVRTLVGAHLTLLAEFGWIAGWAWLSSIGLALCGVRTSPRAGLAFAGLALSGCSSTVFDWPVLFDYSELGGLGRANWILSWGTLALFAALGVRLSAAALRAAGSPRAALRRLLAALAVAALPVLAARLVPPGDAPRVRDGYAAAGAAPRTLALHDASWSLREVCARAGRDVLVPVRPVSRYPSGLGLGGVGRVLLLGDCREWARLVPKGVPVVCAED